MRLLVQTIELVRVCVANFPGLRCSASAGDPGPVWAVGAGLYWFNPHRGSS